MSFGAERGRQGTRFDAIRRRQVLTKIGQGSEGLVTYSNESISNVSVRLGLLDGQTESLKKQQLPSIVFQRAGPRRQGFIVSPPLEITPDGTLEDKQPNAKKLDDIVAFIMNDATSSQIRTDANKRRYLYFYPSQPEQTMLTRTHNVSQATDYEEFMSVYKVLQPNIERMGNYIRRILRSNEDAQDILQKVLLKV